MDGNKGVSLWDMGFMLFKQVDSLNNHNSPVAV